MAALHSSHPRLAVMASLAWGAIGCSVRTVPPGARIVERVDVITREDRLISGADVEERLATRETEHFPLFQPLAGVPVLGLLDALTVEYHTFDRFVLQRDLERVQRFYRARGFYEARVWAGRVVPTDEGVRVEIHVDEGAPVLIRSAESHFPALLPSTLTSPEELEALTDAQARVKDLVSRLATQPIAKGEEAPRFDEQRYETIKRDVQRALTDEGFAYARVDGRVSVDLVKHEATVRFDVDPGPRCTFGPITINGEGEIPERQVRARLGFREGREYSTEAIDAAHDELASLGVFGAIEIAPQLAQPTDGEPLPTAVPVVVNLQPVKLRTVKAGVGAEVGSRIETHAVVGWEDRNLLGGLRHMAVELRPGVVFFPTRAETLLSQRVTDYIPEVAGLFSFKQPSFPFPRTDLRFDVGGQVHAPQSTPVPDPVPSDYNIVGYYELDTSVGVERYFRFPRLARSSAYLGGFLRLQLDHPFSYNLDEPPEGYERVLIPHIDTIASWDFRKDRSGKPTRIEPHNGVFTGLEFQFAFGDALDLRVQPQLRLYEAVNDNVVVALRWTTGLLFPFNYGSSLRTEGDAGDVDRARDLQLLSFRAFYSGGPFSNRGYGYREVGPHAVLPFVSQRGISNELLPSGGMGMWELSGEVRVWFGEDRRFGMVAFLDASDVVRTIEDFRFTHPHLSPGLGLRLATPVGPIRLDVGFRPPYLQHLGHEQLAPDEGGPQPGESPPFPWAWSLAIGEAF